MPLMARDVGVRLRHARKLRGFTQQELAKNSGVKQATISELETGESKSPVGTNLVSLAQSLRVSAEWLASGRGSMDGTEPALPPEAVKFAREWLKLTPEVRVRVADMVKEMVKVSAADQPAAEDGKVAAAYGHPGRQRSKQNPK